MVKPEDLPKFFSDVFELFGFLMSQEIAISPLTPRDTTKMARSFPGTYKFSNNKINWTTPFYTDYVNNGTNRIIARRFIEQNFHQKSRVLMKKAFRVVDKRYKQS